MQTPDRSLQHLLLVSKPFGPKLLVSTLLENTCCGWCSPFGVITMASSVSSEESSWDMVGDHSSMVGQAVDQYVWLRTALAFVDMGVDEYGHLARKVGSRAAAEVMLLAVSRACGDDVSKWNRAKKLGIPWQQKRWTALTELQTNYNSAVAKKIMPSVAEDDALSRPSAGVDNSGLFGLSAAASMVGDSVAASIVGGPAEESMVGGDDQQSMIGGAAAAASSMVGYAATAAASPYPQAAPPPSTSPYEPKPGLGFTPPAPAHPVPSPFGLNEVSCPSGSSEWPSPAQVGTVRKMAAKWKVQGARGDVRRTEQHFTQEIFHQHGMVICNHNAMCKFTDRPKYEVHLQRPNDFDLDEVACSLCGLADESFDYCVRPMKFMCVLSSTRFCVTELDSCVASSVLLSTK